MRAAGVRRRGHQAVGQLGGRRHPRRPGRRATTSIPTRSTRSTTSAAVPGRGRARRAALSAGAAGLRAGRVVQRRPRLRRAATPRRSSPRTRPSGTPGVLRRHQVPARRSSAAIPTTSRSCPASARSSATPSPRPGSCRSTSTRSPCRRTAWASSRASPASRCDTSTSTRPSPPSCSPASGDVLDNNRSRLQVVANIVERDRPTLRQLLHRLAGARGHNVVAGTPLQVADIITEWFDNGAADGFNVMPPLYPQLLDDVQRAGRADPPGSRHLPHRVPGHHAARALRPAPSGVHLQRRSRPGRGRLDA